MSLRPIYGESELLNTNRPRPDIEAAEGVSALERIGKAPIAGPTAHTTKSFKLSS
jgi:hypothetical protein